ncbi:MAG: OmpH family outer membrane protein [Rhodobacterales bacterium]|nr:OmpH family outer membrane protein [Rhodobacterales bacterium]MDX5392095.1 OmpH family outer membrane protein [Rhodobacterales bacterium]MDX5491786.1 OmpH family outer membrane protein [Rhodobacterales bacterium]
MISDRGRAGWRVTCALVIALCLAVGGPALAQESQLIRSPILSLDQDRMFAASDFGRRFDAALQADGARLEIENRRIESELEAEEKDLTQRRPAMSPEAFRALADAFDTKVQRIRTEQTAKARALAQRTEEAQRQFIAAARPVLEQLMIDAGAVVIIDPRSVVMSRSAIDVTDEAIRRINDSIGDGTDKTVPPQEAPGAPKAD